MFVNRKNELVFLDQKYKEKKSQLILIYGRRRIGKTELTRQFAKNKDHIYYFVENLNIKTHLSNLSEIVGKKYNLPLKFNNFEELFNFLKDKNLILIFDEFQEFLKEDKNFLNNLQKVWDKSLKESNLFLILVGSSMSVFYKMLSYNSPIYGRRTGDWEVKKLAFSDISKFLPAYSKEDLVKTYGILGGVPEYLLKFNPKKDFWHNIEDNILKKGSFLYNEMQMLLSYELKELNTYLLILKSISEGVNKLGEIASKNYLQITVLPKYLQTLIRLGFVDYVLPFPYKARKKGIYIIKDNFTWFWFRFVFRNKTALENLQQKSVLNEIKKDFNQEFGLRFELIAKEFLVDKFGVDFRKGWHKEIDIDLLAFDEKNIKLMAFEVKWKNLDLAKSKKILNELESKIQYLPIELKKYRVKIGLIGKNIKGKNRLRKQGFLIFDLKDF
ncbi:ATP-binding protein [Candidatus Parcubacteria bacterium]|nr:ATP-binding protein [Candidatus Parcubacteria bacterium]